MLILNDKLQSATPQSASGIAYDNTTSQLEATKVQDAIDEINDNEKEMYSILSNALGNEIAEYREEGSYTGGALVTHDGKLYRCKQEIGAPLPPVMGEWIPAYWEEVSAIKLIETLQFASNINIDFYPEYKNPDDDNPPFVGGSKYSKLDNCIKAIYNKTTELNSKMPLGFKYIDTVQGPEDNAVFVDFSEYGEGLYLIVTYGTNTGFQANTASIVSNYTQGVIICSGESFTSVVEGTKTVKIWALGWYSTAKIYKFMV